MVTVGGTGSTETDVVATKVPSPFVALAVTVYWFVPGTSLSAYECV
jgi:hypothetical protein